VRYIVLEKFYVVARDRSVLVDGNMTLREVIKYLDKNGQTFSLRRTLQLYGLHFVEERSFTSKYKAEFELSSSKSMWDIKIKELDLYKRLLFTTPFRLNEGDSYSNDTSWR